MVTEKISPGMKQYLDIKKDYPDAFLLFRMGDFYELFYDDAVRAAQYLEIALTSRNKNADNPIPMAGVPFHSAQQYIDSLVDLGYKVAIAEQMENPKDAKGVVKREVVQVVTPGTAVDKLDNDKANNYLTAVDYDKAHYALAYLDLATGEFFVTKVDDYKELISEVSSLETKELVLGFDMDEVEEAELESKLNVLISKQIDYEDEPYENLVAKSLSDIEKKVSYKLLSYIKKTQMKNLSHLQPVRPYEIKNFLKMDYATKKSLELVVNARTGKKQATLLWLVDETKTAMGSRMMKTWIDRPLIRPSKIKARQDIIETLLEHFFERADLIESLKGVYDIERLASRVSFGKASAVDFLQLLTTLQKVPAIKNILVSMNSSVLENLINGLDSIPDLVELLSISIAPDAPRQLTEGGVIKDGYSQQLDEYRLALKEGTAWIAELEARECEKTGISGLRIDYNRKDGYFFHVTNSQLDKIPEYFYRKATLKNSERFGTTELAKIESRMLEAREKSSIYEYDLFMEIRQQVETYISQIQNLAKTIAEIDCLQALTELAESYQYVRPDLTEGGRIIDIQDGRHPVVEKVLGAQEYIPNDIYLNEETDIELITGPNMSGKSTFMRQLALTVILAQMGSYVPATSARLPIFDAIFTRIGASDDLTSGQSTFMVEMMEANNALSLASDRSLILFDELGRGTATYDGMALAQSIIEYIHNNIHAKTLFATHYHELTELDQELSKLSNVHVATLEENGDVTFLHKIEEGAADKSYGIHVAKIAGMPNDLLSRAESILQRLESKEQSKSVINSESNEINEAPEQLNIFETSDDKLRQSLEDLDLMSLTPMEAMNYLWELKKNI